MTNAKQELKRKRGGQKGNQNARKHGRYSAILMPVEEAAINYVKALDDRAQRMLFSALCLKFLPREYLPSSIPIRSRPVPGKAERMPVEPDLGIDLDAWAREQNVDLEAIWSEVFKTIPGWGENE